MRQFKKIWITLAVIFFTALSIYNTQRAVPDGAAYNDYAFSYLLYVGESFIILLLVALVKYHNRIIRACYISCAAIYCSVMWKAYHHTIEAHNDYDQTLLVIAYIVSVLYLMKPYCKDLLSLLKAIINQIHLRCRRIRTRPHK